MRCFQCLAVEELHDDEVPPIVRVNVIDRADARMVQRRGGLRFALQPLKRHLITFKLIGQKFQCYTAGQPSVVGRPNHTHASVAELFDDSVVRSGLPNHGSSFQHSPNDFASFGKRFCTR